MTDQLHALLTSHDALVFAAGFAAGVAAIRRLTRWTLGGKA